jgi:hypothetical protein
MESHNNYLPTTSISTSAPNLSHTASVRSLRSCIPPRIESARSWLDRSRHFVAKAIEELDGSPRSVAHAFLCRRRLTSTTRSGTGVAFVDCMLSIKNEHRSNVIFEIAGRPETGKTWTLLVLAASYLVQTATRPNRNGGENSDVWPPVIILDAECGMHMPHLINALQSAILVVQRLPSSEDHGHVQSAIQQEIAFHLGRVHWVPLTTKEEIPLLFEVMRPALLSKSAFDAPPMIIIDAINSFESSDKIQPDLGVPSTHEVMRQLDRLLQACQQDIIIFASRIITSNASSTTTDLWKRRFVTQTVTLERHNDTTSQNEFVAIFPSTAKHSPLPFRIEFGRIVTS